MNAIQTKNENRLIRLLHPEIRAVAPEPGGAEQPLIDFCASDETCDRYQEVILASGWELDNYRKNPVFQNSHQYGDVLFTLGRAESTEVKDGKLMQRVKFAIDVNPVARIAYGLYRGGFLNAVSVGFDPIEIERCPVDSQGRPMTDWLRRYKRQELLEVSAVSIPANPNALQQGIRSGAVSEADIHETVELLRALLAKGRITPTAGNAPHEPKYYAMPDEFRGQSAVPATPAGATGGADDVAQWLQLLRALKSFGARNDIERLGAALGN